MDHPHRGHGHAPDRIMPPPLGPGVSRARLRRHTPVKGLERFGFLAPGALTLYLIAKGAHPILPGWPCPLRALTGIPCPTCFLTRATAAALNLRLEEAWHWHAFGPPTALLLVVWSLQAIRKRRVLPWPVPTGALLGTGAALLLYWAGRLVAQFGFGVQAFPSG